MYNYTVMYMQTHDWDHTKQEGREGRREGGREGGRQVGKERDFHWLVHF